MFDVAKAAGVSQPTVSRALSGSPLVSERTRRKVLKAAEEVDYHVNLNAPGLRHRRADIIEIVVPTSRLGRDQMSDPFCLEMISCLCDELHDRGFGALIAKTAPWRRSDGFDSVRCGRADGVIILGQGQDAATLTEFAAKTREVVVWGGRATNESYSVVGIDNVLGGRLATSHLLNTGRRRIAFFGDFAEREVQLRHQGHLAVLQARGIADDPSLYAPCPFEVEGARHAIAEFLRTKPAFDAVFCANDVIAISAIGAFAAAGIRVPEDVAVIGFDDIAAAKSASPCLTTIGQQIRLGASVLVQRLSEVINGAEPDAVLIPARLVVRDSCGVVDRML